MQMNCVPDLKINDKMDKMDKEICSICLHELSNELHKCHQCKKEFHKECITNVHKCPLCRYENFNKDYCVPHVNDMIREQREILLDGQLDWRSNLIRIPNSMLIHDIIRMIIEEQIEQIHNEPHNNPNNNTIHV